MNPKRILSKIVGVTQTGVGGVIMLFAFFIFYNIFDLQTALGFTEESVGLYLWTLLIFGLLSVISGLFLVYEPS
jgi:hypothetical protein